MPYKDAQKRREMQRVYEKRAAERHIPLTQESALARLHYDEQTGLLYWRANAKSHTRFTNKVAGKKSGHGKIDVRVDGRCYGAHQLIWLMVHGYIPSFPRTIDHVNGDPADNRLSNLRECAQSENLRNCKKRSDNTTGLTGVYQSKSGLWLAYIQRDRQFIRLGNFDVFSEAARARLRAEKELFGEFRRKRDPEQLARLGVGIEDLMHICDLPRDEAKKIVWACREDRPAEVQGPRRTRGRRDQPLVERFMRYVSPEPNTGCWLWTGSLSMSGVARFCLSDSSPNSMAHRVSYELFVGDLRKEEVVTRTCSVPSCVNLQHIAKRSARRAVGASP